MGISSTLVKSVGLYSAHLPCSHTTGDGQLEPHFCFGIVIGGVLGEIVFANPNA